MPYGSVVLTLTNGRGLSNKDLFGRNDAYAKVQLTAGTPSPPPPTPSPFSTTARAHVNVTLCCFIQLWIAEAT
jgi:hypothetical protein